MADASNAELKSGLEGRRADRDAPIVDAPIETRRRADRDATHPPWGGASTEGLKDLRELHYRNAECIYP
jgi:hypothetical protein